MVKFDIKKYNEELEALFVRFPSVQNVPFGDAYKPGLERMLMFDDLLGNPSRSFRSIHIAGTNGKGSVSNMLASVCAGEGLRTGLYTSPHILDFRERMRIAEPYGNAEMVPKEWVYKFILNHKNDFERLQLSFFEITTGMALKWFADMGVDIAVIETGLGGRLDSTNIITPILSIVTTIGLDHCAMLGNTLGEIAGEKAGIFKKGVPALVGEAVPETERVFIQKAEELGISLTFAENMPFWKGSKKILRTMDLQGEYQKANLRTVEAALGIIGINPSERVAQSIIHTAQRMDFHGRWEKLCDHPLTICDIGHNPQALSHNFSQLAEMGREMIIVYAVMADKDLDSILPLMPREAKYIFATPTTKRALPSSKILEKALAYGLPSENLFDGGTVADAVTMAQNMASNSDNTVIYIGGSTFAVAEAVRLYQNVII